MLKKKFPSLASIGSDGNTAFLRAARAGHLDKVLEQLKNNVDINTSNANGLNALHLASKDGHIHVVSELLKRGAKVDSATKKGNTALHIASLAGQEDVVRHLVDHGACVNVQSQNGFTPLYMAAQENHDAVVRFLLSNGANQSLATEDGFTPLAVAMQQGHDKVVAVLLENDTRGKVRLPALHIAAKKDDTKAAALLLQNEHNPDVTSKSGFTPLHIASHYGNEAIANLLLSKGADVNYAAKHNITPLHVAAKWGKANMVSVLLSRGANIEAKTRDGLTPLHCAARSGHEQVVDMLLERGAPISAKTKNGLAALHMSSQGDHVDAARILLYHRAPVDDVTVDYLTALHVAAHCGHVGVARLLLDRKADPNARALNGFTPLHIACKKNRIKVVELLLKHGASIEATTESGLTPLHVASFMGCMNIVIYLVQNEAGPDVKTVRGETPLHLAARANQTDIIRILLRNGAQVDARAREQQTPLHIASRLGNVDIVMLLLQHGASVDSTTKDLYTALHIAAKEGQDEVASVLLENGASLEATTKKGFTPLHLAAKYGHMNVAKLLLRRDAPVDAQGKNGVTPLHVASHYDHQNVALLLLEKGASPHATAKNGHTPLHIAARKNQMDIATTLLEYGAKANAESKAGFTPLHLSAQEGHTDMSNLLIEHQADVNQKAKNGLTPLHLCAQEDRVEVGGILLKNEADVNSTTKAGYTPLHVASHFGQMGMVRLLLANGASVTPTTAVNYTPLHQAAQQGHSVIVNELLAAGADPNATTNQGQTAMSIAQKLGYISVMETLKGVTDPPISPTSADEKYKVVSPETMQETFMSDSEDEGGEDTMLSEQPYHYLTVDEMKGLGDDSLPIDVTRDERDNRDIDDTISPQHMKETYTSFAATDNVDIHRHPQQVGFLVSFLVDARGGAMRGVRHSGVRVIVPPRRASMPLRVTCRYLKRDKLPHPPPLMEGEALASRILELGPVGAKFLGPVMIEVPHFGSLRGREREIVILRSDNGETWREHTFEASEEAVHDVLSSSFEKDEINQLEENPRMTRILTTEFPHYIAVVSRVRQEVHAIGPEGGMVSSTVVPQVQAVFPHGALTKKIKVGLQAQPIPAELTAKLLGNRVAVSPIVTVEPRRRKFHKPISLTIPVPQAANKGMINQYSGDAPTLRLLCSITGGTTRAQWEDVTGSTPLTFVNDCVSFTTTVSARFWLMDCRNITEATKMATELYKEAIHVPFMAKFVVFAKRVDTTEARLRVFCMTDDKEDKTLEHQEHFTEVAKSRDVEVLEGKTQFLEFAGNLVPVTKSGDQLQLGFRAFKENRLPFTTRVKDPHADAIGRIIFMREPKVAKGDVPQQPICILNIVLPEEIIPEPDLPDNESLKHSYITHTSGLQRLSDISNLLGEDWVKLASELGVSTSEINSIKTELCESSVAHQGLAMLRLWLQNAGNKASGSSLEEGLRNIGRDDIIQQTVFQTGTYALSEELSPSYTTKQGVFRRVPGETIEIIGEQMTGERTLKGDQDERTLRIEERIAKKGGRRITPDNDSNEKKYEAEEKAVEEESLKSVSERKKEIEKRLSQDIDEKSKERMVTKESKITTKEIKSSKETMSTKETSKTKDVKATEKSKLLDDKTEKETAEEKAVSPEPAHLSFDEKRKSFEMGITPKEKLKQQDSLTQSFLEEERKSVQEVVVESVKTKTEETKVEEKELSFSEKRRSFEQGLTMKQPGDKLPATERKKEVASDRNAETDQKTSDFRRDSQLFQDVSEGLDNFEKGVIKPAAQDLLSPGVVKTPPPSPAEFLKEAPDNKKWSVETPSTLLSGEELQSRGGDKNRGAVEASVLTREEQKSDEKISSHKSEKKTTKTAEDTSVLEKRKSNERQPSSKSPSPDKFDKKKFTNQKTNESQGTVSRSKTTNETKTATKRSSPESEKKEKSTVEGKTTSKTDNSKKGKKEAKVAEKGKDDLKARKDSGPQKETEDKIKKEKFEVGKRPSPEKKTSFLGKTMQTIKKPFQDKSDGKEKSQERDEKKQKPNQKKKSQEKEETASISSQGTSKKSHQAPGASLRPEVELSQQKTIDKVPHEVSKEDDENLREPKTEETKTKPFDSETPDSLKGGRMTEVVVGHHKVPFNQSKDEAKGSAKKEILSPSKPAGKPNGKGKGKQNTSKTPSLEEETLPLQKPSSSILEKAAEMIEKPFQLNQRTQQPDSEKEKHEALQPTAEENSKISKEIMKSEDQTVIVETNVVLPDKEHVEREKTSGKGRDKRISSKSFSSGEEELENPNATTQETVEVVFKPPQDCSKQTKDYGRQELNEGNLKSEKSALSSSSGTQDMENAKKVDLPKLDDGGEGCTAVDDQSKRKRKNKGKSTEKLQQLSPEKEDPHPSMISREETTGEKESLKKQDANAAKDDKKKAKGKNKQKGSPPEKPVKEISALSSTDQKVGAAGMQQETVVTKTTKKSINKLGKQPTIEKAVEMVTSSILAPEKQEEIANRKESADKTEILVEGLSLEKNAKITESSAIEPVSKQPEETSRKTILDKSKRSTGSPTKDALKERDVFQKKMKVPQGRSAKIETNQYGFEGVISSEADDKVHLTGNEKQDKTDAPGDCSVEESSQGIVERVKYQGRTDLVAKPPEESGTSGPKGKGNKKASKVQETKQEFQHIQKTIDNAMIKLDQFVDIVSDKASKQASSERSLLDDMPRMGIKIPSEEEKKVGVKATSDSSEEVTNTGAVSQGIVNLGMSLSKGADQPICSSIEQGKHHLDDTQQDIKVETTDLFNNGSKRISKTVSSSVQIIEITAQDLEREGRENLGVSLKKTDDIVDQGRGELSSSTQKIEGIEHIEGKEKDQPGRELKHISGIAGQKKEQFGLGTQEVKESAQDLGEKVESRLSSQMKLAGVTVEKGREQINSGVERIETIAQDSLTAVSEKIDNIFTEPHGGHGEIEIPLDREEDLMAIQRTLGQSETDEMSNRIQDSTCDQASSIEGRRIISPSRNTSKPPAVGVGKTEVITGEKISYASPQPPPTFDALYHESRASTDTLDPFETLETQAIPNTTGIEKSAESPSISNDEIGRIIKEMESQLLKKEFEGKVKLEGDAVPRGDTISRVVQEDVEFSTIEHEENEVKPYVTTPSQSRRVIGIGGSQRLTQAERPVVRVITEYVGDSSENEPEEDSTYTVLEPEVKERRKVKIRFSPDMYKDGEAEEMIDSFSEEHRSESGKTTSSGDQQVKMDSKAQKKSAHIERRFERMTSQTKEADPSMTTITDGEFQRIVSQLSLEEMDQALQQWDVGGMTPSEVDSKDLTLSSEETISPLQPERDEESQEGAAGYAGKSIKEDKPKKK